MKLEKPEELSEQIERDREEIAELQTKVKELTTRTGKPTQREIAQQKINDLTRDIVSFKEHLADHTDTNVRRETSSP